MTKPTSRGWLFQPRLFFGEKTRKPARKRQTRKLQPRTTQPLTPFSFWLQFCQRMDLHDCCWPIIDQDVTAILAQDEPADYTTEAIPTLPREQVGTPSSLRVFVRKYDVEWYLQPTHPMGV